LTTDNLVVEGVAGLGESSEVIKSAQDLTDPSAIRVLAACQSLVRMDEELIGDPLEKTCLEWAEWALTKRMYKHAIDQVFVSHGVFRGGCYAKEQGIKTPSTEDLPTLSFYEPNEAYVPS